MSYQDSMCNGHRVIFSMICGFSACFLTSHVVICFSNLFANALNFHNSSFWIYGSLMLENFSWASLCLPLRTNNLGARDSRRAGDAEREILPDCTGSAGGQ